MDILYDMVRVRLVRQLLLLCVVVFCAFGTSVAQGQLAGLPQVGTQGAAIGFCHGIHPRESVPVGYGVPYSVFTGTPLMKAWCNNDAVAAIVGDGASSTYIYKSGYVREAGGWKSIDFVGFPMEGDWFVGTAQALLEKPEGNGSVLAYICEVRRGVRRCGCTDAKCSSSSWQMQTYASGYRSKNKPEQQDMFVTRLTVTGAYVGSIVTLEGFNFASRGNDVYFNDTLAVRGVPSLDSTTLRFKVPRFPPNKYVITVRDGTRTGIGKPYFWLRTPGVQTPRITSVAPLSFGPYDTVTIQGTGFTLQNNDVVTSFGTISGVPSRGGTELSFVYPGIGDGQVFRRANGMQSGFTAKTGFVVANVNGISNQLYGTLRQ